MNKIILFLLTLSACYTAGAQTEAVKALISNSRELEYPANLKELLTADSLAVATNDVAGRAFVNSNLALVYFTRDAEKCLASLFKARALFLHVGNRRQANGCLQNVGFLYEEQKNNPAEALKYTRQALEKWIELNDTLAAANLYKYEALLQGKLHRFAEAKQNGRKAIELFSAKKFIRGVAVSYFDLAAAYSEEHMPDSAIYLLCEARKIWREYNDTFRITGIEIELMKNYISAGNRKEALATHFETRSLLKSDHVTFQQRLDFYKYSSELFATRKEQSIAGEFRVKYNSLADSLKQKGVNYK